MKKIIASLIAVIMMLTLTSCGKKTSEQKTGGVTGTIKVTDIKGNKVEFDKLPQRIISLSPANTEILFAIGAGSKVVGDTVYCDYPNEAKNVQKVGDFNNPNIELIKKLKPDVVLAGGYIHDDIIKVLQDSNIKVVSTEASNLAGTFDSINLIGKIAGKEENAKKIVLNMKSVISSIEEKNKNIKKPKVFYIVWTEPLTTAGAGTFINDVINAAGGVNVASGVKEWAKYSPEQLIKDNPDIIVSAKFSTNKGLTKEDIMKNPLFSKLPCVKQGKVYIVKDDNIISRSGPRIVDSISELSDVFKSIVSK